MKLLLQATVAALSLLVSANADGHSTYETVSIYNTFEDPVITGGNEIIFEEATSTLSDEVEFDGFPAPGFYAIDILHGYVHMTLKDNSAASDLLLPEGRFDRYYLAFSDDIVGAAYVPPGQVGIAEHVTAEVLPPGFQLGPLGDPLMTGVVTPVTMPNGGLKIIIGPGADLTELGQEIVVGFDLVPTMRAFNTFEDPVLTGGNEIIFDKAVRPFTDGPEFLGFPAGGFYDIDYDYDAETISWTLKDNSGASDLLLPEGRFDRYYIDFGRMMPSMAYVRPYPSSSISSATSVEVLPAGYVLGPLGDPFGSGVPTPASFPSGGLQVTIGPGADLTELGQEIVIGLDFKKSGKKGKKGKKGGKKMGKKGKKGEKGKKGKKGY